MMKELEEGAMPPTMTTELVWRHDDNEDDYGNDDDNDAGIVIAGSLIRS